MVLKKYYMYCFFIFLFLNQCIGAADQEIDCDQRPVVFFCYSDFDKAVAEGDLNLVNLCLATYNVDVNRVLPRKNRFLHTAVFYNQIRIAEALIAAKADVDAPHGDNGMTPLHVAAQHGHKNMAEILVAAKADIASQTHSLAQPLHTAVQQNKIDMVKFFLLQGVSPFIQRKYELTPFHDAIQGEEGEKDNYATFAFLLQADRNIHDIISTALESTVLASLLPKSLITCIIAYYKGMLDNNIVACLQEKLLKKPNNTKALALLANFVGK